MDWFALASYADRGGVKPALVYDGALYDMAAAWRATSTRKAPAWVTAGLQTVFWHWDELGDEIMKLGEKAAKPVGNKKLRPVSGGADKLALPFRPRVLYCAGANYREHAQEMKSNVADKSTSRPYFFIKSVTSAIGPGETVRIPAKCEKPDWEVELGVVIGKPARNSSNRRALDCVAGYTVVNDVTARDLNRRHDFASMFVTDWFGGKSHDTFAPIGPWVVPKAFVKNPNDLDLSLTVSGNTMQDSNTEQMIFNVHDQSEYLTEVLGLMPGDVIATGTPSGVGMGRGIFLKPGDVMSATVEKIGTLTNPVAAAKGKK